MALYLLAVTLQLLATHHRPNQSVIYSLSLYNCIFWIFHRNGIILYVIVCSRLLSHSMFSRVICIAAWISSSFFFLQPNIIPLHGCATFCWSIHQVMDIWGLGIGVLSCCQHLHTCFVWTNVFVSLGRVPKSVISGSHLYAWLSEEIPRCFPKSYHSTFAPATRKGHDFSTSPPIFVMLFFVRVLLVSVKYDLFVVLISIS